MSENDGMSILEFLEARISEDEHYANNARGLLGNPNPWSEWRTLTKWYDAISRADAMHIERQSPSRVMAECGAKRSIIAEHTPVDFSGIGMKSPNACSRCGADLNMHDWDWTEDSFPCQTLRAVAAVYADHPDYQQEWSQ